VPTAARFWSKTTMTPETAPRGENPLPRPNTDPKLAPGRVDVEWILHSPPILIGSEPRTLCLIRGRFGEVQVRSVRVQFPLDLPGDFEAMLAAYHSADLVTKRGIVVARLQGGKNRATCHCDLPPPMAKDTGAVLWSHRFVRCSPQALPADYALWAGVKREMVASPGQGIAVVCWATHRALVECYVGGV
jgi:hypothetical protein